MRNFVAPLVKMVVFAAVTITLTALLGLTIANSTLGATTGYTARFADATGLNVGDDIRMSGVRIGQVTDIIKSRNMIGQRYVSLGLGAGDTNAVLRPGDTIPVSRTQPALNLTQLFNGFQPLFQALQPGDVNRLAGELIQVLQGEGGTIDSVLAHTASLASTVASKDQVIGQVIDNLNTVLTTVNDRTNEVSGLIDQLQQLATGLAQQRGSIGNAIGALGELTTSTAGLLSSVRPPLKDDIAALGDLAGTLADHGDTVDRFLAGLPHKVETINRVSSYGGWYNYYLCSMSGRVGVSDLGISVDLPLIPVPGTPMAKRCQ